MTELDDFYISPSSGEVQDMISPGALLVDVRTPVEFKEKHIKGSINIPVDEIGIRITDLVKDKKLSL